MVLCWHFYSLVVSEMETLVVTDKCKDERKRPEERDAGRDD